MPLSGAITMREGNIMAYPTSPTERTKCPHCGASLKTNAKYCSKCGAILQNNNNMDWESNVAAPDAIWAEQRASTAKIQKKKTIILLAIAVLVLVVVGSIIYTVSHFIRKQEVSSQNVNTQAEDMTFMPSSGGVNSDGVRENTVSEQPQQSTSSTKTQTTEPIITAEPAQQIPDSGSEYVLPDSDSRYLDISEVEALSTDQLKLARNELYARHGRMFRSAELQAYFDSKSWYEPRYTPDEYDQLGELFNVYEIANRDLLLEVEQQRNGN